MSEMVSRCCNEIWDSGILARVNDIRPVGPTVEYDEELTTSMRSKINSNLLKWPGVYLFAYHGSLVLDQGWIQGGARGAGLLTIISEPPTPNL